MRMRKKRHGNERLEALGALVYQDAAERWEALPAAFVCPEQPLRMEIGCGKGGFITGISLSEPSYNYLAVEKVGDVLVCAVEKYAQSRSLGTLACNGGWQTPDGTVYAHGERWMIPLAMRGNVRFVRGDAAEVLSHIPDGIVESIYANFSDPWPKKGYAERRLTSPSFLAAYQRVLRPGGMLRMKTDNDTLFAYSLETVAASGLRLVYQTEDLHHSERAAQNIMTEYERNFSAQNIPIKYLEAQKPMQ